MPEIILPYHYLEYEWQRPLVKAFKDGKEIYLVLHRRGGKDAWCWNRVLIPSALQKPGTYQLTFPTLKQARDTIWEGKDEKGRDILDYYVPRGAIVKPDNADMKLTLRVRGGTSTIQLFGTNKGQYEALRGKPSNGLVRSEAAYQDPRGLDVMRPMLLKTGGFLVHNSTPNGNNDFKRGYYHAKNDYLAKGENSDYFVMLKTIADTYDHEGKPLITEADIQKERDRGKTEDYIQQEYYCSFMQGIEGTYLGKQLQKVRDEGRISRHIRYDENTPVYTAWDLGVADFMSIIFFQLIGNEIHIIDFYENSGYSFLHYAKILKEKGYYYGGHYAPHDVMAREMGTSNKQERAMSRLEKAEEVGIEFEKIDLITFESGVENARSILPRCFFNEEKTRLLITHLEQWGRKWNDTVQQYSDFEDRNVHTHAGAAFRYMSTVVVEETHHASNEYAQWDRRQEAIAASRTNPYTGG